MRTKYQVLKATHGSWAAPLYTLPPHATHHPPGSAGKIAEMQARYAQNYLLHHPLDYRPK